MKKFFFVIGLFIALALVFFLFFQKPFEKNYFVSGEGIVFYKKNRGEIDFSKSLVSENQSLTLYKVVFDSNGTKVYGLLRVPKSVGKKFPAVIILAGSGIKKEGEDESRGKDFSELGFVTLTIDQRGEGESKAGFKGIELQYEDFLEGKEIDFHKAVFDVLKAVDLLSSLQEVDSTKIIVFGESMGGRNAIIAGGIEERIAGVIGVSTAGYGLPSQRDENATRFIKSIDPDNYVSRISPRPLLMIHSVNDKVIPLSQAEKTFEKAREPKEFVRVDECGHGYCGQMLEPIRKWVKRFFE